MKHSYLVVVEIFSLTTKKTGVWITVTAVCGDTNLLVVAIHELGHALGLGHSGKTTAIMFKYKVGEVRLDIDDIQAIQALYGAPGLPRPQHDGMEEMDIDTVILRYFFS